MKTMMENEVSERCNALVYALKLNPGSERMTMDALREKAIALRVSPGKCSKAELIHAIQRAEGNSPCFEASIPKCPHLDCCFRADCIRR